MGILKDTYIVNKIDTTPICRTLEKQNKILKENAEKELKARDRVNITLEEYERLKNENIKTKALLDSYQKFYIEFGKRIMLNPEKLLKSKLIKAETCRNELNLSNMLHIVFEIEESEFLNVR